ncbi:MAG: hypothetical protein HOW73_28845 [Polyangiaceae bacterium]|nr:hypothetical protein [Polyangiaceae bacterium]
MNATVLARPSAIDGPEALASDGSSVVFTGSAFVVRFDRYLDPRSAIRQAYCLQSDAAVVEGFEDCTAAISTSPIYDPVTRALTIYLDAPLTPEKVHTFTILSPRDGTDVGFRAMDGAFLDVTQSFSFTTGPDTDPPLGVEEPPAPPACEEIVAMLGSCATCHVVTSQTSPPEGFTVDRAGLLASIGRTAHETSVGGDADESQERPGRFGAAMPLIDDKRSAGNSYLLYKLLAYGQADDELAPGETERLRSMLVVGLPMPPPSEDPDAPRGPFTIDELTVLSRWISGGAPCN